MLTIAVTNQKGGVGKTTTTYHLARASSLRGIRTLVVDLDPQGNLTDSLADFADGNAGMADVLSAASQLTLDEVVAPTPWEGVHLAPSGADALALVRNELVTGGPGREMRLREALAPVSGSFDLALIDCAPALDTLAVNAFAAADGILVVSQSRLYSATGLAHLLNTVEAVHAYYNPSVSLMGVIVNQHRARTRQGAHWVDELTTACRKRGLRLFDPPIPDAVAISDAAESGMGLDEWPGAAKLASLYDAHLSTLLAAGSGVL